VKKRVLPEVRARRRAKERAKRAARREKAKEWRERPVEKVESVFPTSCPEPRRLGLSAFLKLFRPKPATRPEPSSQPVSVNPPAASRPEPSSQPVSVNPPDDHPPLDNLTGGQPALVGHPEVGEHQAVEDPQ
jgi:hypothetical protein